MKTSERNQVQRKIIEIQGNRLTYRRGKLHYRDFTPVEEKEIAQLQEALIHLDERDYPLFSAVCQLHGCEIIAAIPENHAQDC